MTLTLPAPQSTMVGVDKDNGKPRQEVTALVSALIRVSTKQQDMEMQEYAIAEAEERFNVKVAERFCFPGKSGVIVHKTDGFKECVKRAVQPDRAGLIVYRPDRIMRPEEVDAYGALRDFRIHKKLIFATNWDDPIALWNHNDKTKFVQQMERAAQERLDIKDRTNNEKERLLRNPQNSVTKLPKGVEHVITPESQKKYGSKKAGEYVYTDWAINHIKPAFERFASGKESLNSIAIDLGFDAEASLRYTLQNRWWIGYRTRTHKQPVKYDESGVKVRCKREQHETPWNQATNLADTPLVSPELFDRVQQLLGQEITRPYLQTNTGKFLGTGFLECRCGCNLLLNWDTKRNKPPVYVCSSHQKRWKEKEFHGVELEKCTWKRMRADRVDKAIWKAATDYFQDFQWLQTEILKAQESTEARALQSDLQAAEAVLDGLEKQKKRIQKMIALDEFEDDQKDEDAMTLYSETKAKISAQKIRVATIKAQAQPFGTTDAWAIARAIVRRFSGSENWTAVEDKRAALAEVVERIRLTDDCRAVFVVRGGLPLQRSLYTGTIPAMVKAMDSPTMEHDGDYDGDFSETLP